MDDEKAKEILHQLNLIYWVGVLLVVMLVIVACGVAALYLQGVEIRT